MQDFAFADIRDRLIADPAYINALQNAVAASLDVESSAVTIVNVTAPAPDKETRWTS